MQRVVFAAAACVLALSGCGRAVTEQPLAAFDLTQPAVVEAVLARLPAESRGAFATFTIHHLASSKAFCGDVLVDERGREPATIGDAIRLTLAREEERSRVPEKVDFSTLDPVVRYRLQLSDLQRKRELLIDDREMMLMTREDAGSSADFKEVEAQIEAVTREIAAFRATAPAGA